MQGLLLITVLCVSSSYAQNVEHEASGRVPDTIQWWLLDDDAWRIRTFGLDHDIHVYRVGPISREAAEASTRNNYSDIICRQIEVDIADTRDQQSVSSALKAANLPPYFEVIAGFLFWKPDDVEYRNKTRPKN